LFFNWPAYISASPARTPPITTVATVTTAVTVTAVPITTVTTTVTTVATTTFSTTITITILRIDKDNDLRCRVHKRANKLFGKGDSDHKHRWVEEEFGKRQMKRKEKERRKQAVNGAIGANPSLANLTTANIITAHQQAQLSQLSAAQLAASSMVGVPHPNGGFYPMATNGMAPLSPTTTAKLLGGNLSAAMKKNAQHQFLQVTNGLLGADGGHLTLAPTSPTGTGAHIHHHHHHHLHIQDLASGKLPSPTSDGSDYSPLDHATHAGINGQGLQSMASGLSSSTGTSSGSPSPQLTHHQPQGQMQQNGQQGQTGQQGQGGNGQGGDYPMDAVLTLMQLNAGWVRQ
ncbi:hypothetical protein BC937DRAFT_87673, partial [Endogone sp. FLAS-F59071]